MGTMIVKHYNGYNDIKHYNGYNDSQTLQWVQ
jgi:hypothetical protein